MQRTACSTSLVCFCLLLLKSLLGSVFTLCITECIATEKDLSIALFVAALQLPCLIHRLCWKYCLRLHCSLFMLCTTELVHKCKEQPVPQALFCFVPCLLKICSAAFLHSAPQSPLQRKEKMFRLLSERSRSPRRQLGLAC